MNFAANMLGLDNAVTPMGSRRMERMQQLNEQKERASDPMIMFLVINIGAYSDPGEHIGLPGAVGCRPTGRCLHSDLAGYFFSTMGRSAGHLSGAEDQV